MGLINGRLSSISIHAAREGGDLQLSDVDRDGNKFQSTPPVKAATDRFRTHKQPEWFQSTPPVKATTRSFLISPFSFTVSIHAAREGGDLHQGDAERTFCVSIHAAREGGDCHGCSAVLYGCVFQSTPPVKAATIRSRHPSLYGLCFNPRRP